MRRLIRTRDHLVTPATGDPITLAEAKLQCRLGSSTTEDAQMGIYMKMATQLLESLTGLQIMPAVWELWMDAFPMDGQIELPRAPLSSVVSIKYLDQDLVEQTFDSANYSTEIPAGPFPSRGRVLLLPTVSWPSTGMQQSAVKVQYRAGYVDESVSPAATNVPELVKGLLLMLVSHFYQHRAVTQQGRGEVIQQIPLGMELMIENMRTKSTWEPIGGYAGYSL